MNRRTFLKSSCLACAAVSLAGLQSCASIVYAPSTLNGQKLSIKKSSFESIKMEKLVYEQWVLVKDDKLAFPIGVFRNPQGEYTALYLECTHQGCEVVPEGDFLRCPCHDSEFTNQGKVTVGPAEHDLKTFPIQTDQEYIYILLK